jgi:integrase
VEEKRGEATVPAGGWGADGQAGVAVDHLSWPTRMRCSPNELRGTCATWLRAAGASPELIAPVMGHAHTRMVERVSAGCP